MISITVVIAVAISSEAGTGAGRIKRVTGDLRRRRCMGEI